MALTGRIAVVCAPAAAASHVPSRARAGACRVSRPLAEARAARLVRCPSRRQDARVAPRCSRRLVHAALGTRVRGGRLYCGGRPSLRRSLAQEAGGADSQAKAVETSAERLRQLEGRLQLRRLYRKLLAVQAVLALVQAPHASEEALDPDVELLTVVTRIEGAQQLAAGLQTALAQLRSFAGELFGDDTVAADSALRARVEADFEALTKQAAAWLASLPHRSLEEARAAAEAGIVRPDETGGLRLGVGDQAGRVKAELELLREQPLEVLADVADYSRAVWARLNGSLPARSAQPAALAGLPLPPPSRAAHESRLVQRALDVEAADGALIEAARTRETQLKRRDALRPPLAREIRELDAAVRDARTVLALRTLQLECERIYAALEEEAMEVGDSASARDAELAVIVAEFGALDATLARGAELVARGEVALLADDELDALVRDISDLKGRLGLADDAGAGKDLSLGLLLEKCSRSVREAGGKVTDGAEFLARGVRLLGEDVSGSLALFSRTLSGSTLKPREVQSVRRTSRDLLTFVPFIAILIAPITPVGHVMVFSFLQRYFPGFFPSQFTARRQEMFRKYEDLRQQLAVAEEAAVAATESAALQRAAQVVAALTRGEGMPEETPADVRDLLQRTSAVAEALGDEIADE